MEIKSKSSISVAEAVSTQPLIVYLTRSNFTLYTLLLFSLLRAKKLAKQIKTYKSLFDIQSKLTKFVIYFNEVIFWQSKQIFILLQEMILNDVEIKISSKTDIKE